MKMKKSHNIPLKLKCNVFFVSSFFLRRLFFDSRYSTILPITVCLATKMYLYATMGVYLWPNILWSNTVYNRFVVFGIDLENNTWFSAALPCMYWRIIHGLYHILMIKICFNFNPCIIRQYIHSKTDENHVLFSFL